jgi:hypothetical protein
MFCPGCDRPAPRLILDSHHALATAYSYATLSEKVMSLVTKLEFCRFVFGWLDQSLRNKLMKNGSFVPLQICAWSVE